MRKLVEEKVKDFDPDEDEEAEFKGASIGWCSLVTPHANCCDWTLLTGGILCALAFGASMPCFSLFFGGSVDGVGAGDEAAAKVKDAYIKALPDLIAKGLVTATEVPDEDKFNMLINDGHLLIKPDMSDLKGQSLFMLYVGVGTFLVVWLMISLLSIFAENIAYKTKISYFKAMLEKDAGFYDENSAMSVASRISKETAAIHRGLGEKVGQVVMSYSALLIGFVFAFVIGWYYSLILVASMPVIMCAGGLAGAALMSGMAEAMRAYANSAGYAEQAIQAIKVVHTYGQEALEQRIYTSQLVKTRGNAALQTFKSAFGQGCMFFTFFAFYCYGFYFGGFLRWTEARDQSGEIYKSGTIIAIMFMIVMGAFQAGAAGPHIKAITEGKVAGKLAYDTINEAPVVDPNTPGEKLKREDVVGRIEFKNVNFRYPTRKDLHVLKNFSCVFEAGKTTALVGPSGSGKSSIIQLIERFYEIEKGGEITLDGKVTRNLDLRSLRQNIGYVKQEPALLNTTIKENMLFANPHATE